MITDTQLAVIPARNSVTAMKLNRLKAIYRQIMQTEGTMIKSRDTILRNAWELGAGLNELKEEIGHGNWLLWLTANFRELGRTDDVLIKNAERCMVFNNRNSNSRIPTNFDPESVRKFMWGYIPVKERIVLSGDRKDSPSPHYVTAINNYWKWSRQEEIGQQPVSSINDLRRDFKPMLLDLKDRCGPEWVNAL